MSGPEKIHPSKFGLSLFNSSQDNKPKQKHWSLGELEVALRRDGERYTNKDGPAISAATFRDGATRASKNVDKVHHLGLDIDSACESMEDVEKLFAKFPNAGLAYSTWNHYSPLKDGEPIPPTPRLRLFLPLARPISPAEHSVLWKWAFDYTGGALDKATKDPGRLFYTPRRKNPDATEEPWIKRMEGPLLDPDNLPDGQNVGTLAKNDGRDNPDDPGAFAVTIGQGGATSNQKSAGRNVAKRPPSKVKQSRVIKALKDYPNDDLPYDDWRDVGMALHDWSNGGANGFMIWDNWSRQSKKFYNKKDTQKIWVAFSSKRDSKITIATLFAKAQPAQLLPDEEREPRERGEILEKDERYVAFAKEGGLEYISSFTLKNVERIWVEGEGETIVGDVVLPYGRRFERIEFPRRAWNSRRDFQNCLTSASMSWTGSDHNVQYLMRRVASKAKRETKGTRILGYYAPMNCWAAPGKTITATGDNIEVSYLPSGAQLSDQVRYPDADRMRVKDVAKKALPRLSRLNDPGVILPVIGWFFAAPFKPRIMRLLGHFPILVIWGGQGSGKTTTTSEIFWPLSGVQTGEAYSLGGTKFTMLSLLSCTNSIPVAFDEYKADLPDTQRRMIHRFLRQVYTGEVEGRGRPDQTITTYKLLAPVCMAGETRPEEPALAERFITSIPVKARIEGEPSFQQALGDLKGLDLSLLALPLVRFSLRQDIRRSLADARELTDALVGERKIPLRLRDNLNVMLFGLDMYVQFAEHMGISADLLGDLDVAAAVDAVINDLVEGIGGVKSGLDHFIEELYVMATNGTLVPGQNYVLDTDNNTLYLHFRSSYSLYREHCRRSNSEREVTAERTLWRMIDESIGTGGYVTNRRHKVSFASDRERIHCVVVDLDVAEKNLDIGSFPREHPRSPDGRGTLSKKTGLEGDIPGGLTRTNEPDFSSEEQVAPGAGGMH